MAHKHKSHPQAPLYYPGNAAINQAEQYSGSIEFAFTQILGQIADAQVPESAVTQHEAALSLLFTQLTDDIADGQVPESAVTQHEAALTILRSQIDGWPADSDGFLKNTSGVLSWESSPATVDFLNDIGDVNAPTPGDGDVLAWDDGAGEWVNVPAGSPGPHTHGAEDIEAGTFDAGDFVFPNNLKVTEYFEIVEMTDPGDPAAATARLYAVDFHGETRLRINLPDGRRFDVMADNTLVAKNTSGGSIAKGQVVYVSGSTGNVPNIALAQADSLSTLTAVGVAQEDMANNDFGVVNFTGTIIFDTSAFSAGDVVYVDPDIPGALTATRPTFPDIVQNVGVILVSGVGNGEMLVSPQERDVGSAGGGTIDGSGTADLLAKWSDSDTLTNSIIRDNGSSVFVNVASGDTFSAGFGLYVAVGLEQLRAGNPPTMNFSRVNTSLASPSAVVTNDNLGRFVWRGYNGSALGTGALMESLAAENWSGSAQGAGMRIVTVPNGSTSGSTRLNITHDGLVTTPSSRAEGALTADMSGFTNSSTNLTNMSFAIGANEVWVFDFFGWLNTSGAGGCLFNFTVPTSCGGEFHVWGNGGNTSTIVSGRQATITSNSPAAVNTGTGNDGHVHVRAILINSTNAGTIQLRGLSTAGSSTIVMRKGSHFTARRIS